MGLVEGKGRLGRCCHRRKLRRGKGWLRGACACSGSGSQACALSPLSHTRTHTVCSEEGLHTCCNADSVSGGVRLSLSVCVRVWLRVSACACRRLISLCLEVMTFYISLARQTDGGPGAAGSPPDGSPGPPLPPGHAGAGVTPEARKEVEAYNPIMVLLLRELHAMSPPSQFAKHLPTFYL
jgi:hypothetical protein